MKKKTLQPLKKVRKKTLRLKQKFIVISLLILAIVLPLAIAVNNQSQTVMQHAAMSATDVVLDSLVKQTIYSINQYGWNPSVQGYHINWYINNPTTYQNTGHDGQNELRMYEAMVWYRHRHPGDTSLDSAITRVTATTKSEWGNTSLGKGWVYFILQRLANYSGEQSYWETTMQHWAGSVYASIPSEGVPHGPIVESTAANARKCTDGYRVDQNLENGLALIVAGKKFNNPAWSAAGQKEYLLIKQQAFYLKYNLFARIVCQGQVWNFEAKDGEIGQEIEALIEATKATGDQQYLSVAQQMLGSVSNPATGFIDPTYGGLWFYKLMDTGSVSIGKKVTQQFHILQGAHLANKLSGNKYSVFEENMIVAIQNAYRKPPISGWAYELNPDWTIYQGNENWVSTEASGIAMEAIQTILEDDVNNVPELITPTFACEGSSLCIPSANPTILVATPTHNPVLPTQIQLSNTPSISSSPTQPQPTPPGKANNTLLSLLLMLFASIFQFFLKLFGK